MSRLNALDRATLRAVTAYATPEGTCMVSSQVLSDHLGVHRRRVLGSLRELERLGLLERVPGRRYRPLTFRLRGAGTEAGR